MLAGCGGVRRATKMRDELSLASEGAGSAAILTVVAAVSSGSGDLACVVLTAAVDSKCDRVASHREAQLGRAARELPSCCASDMAREIHGESS